MTWRRTVCLVNGCVMMETGIAASLRFRSRILDIDAPPKRGDVVIDLGGKFVLPGLVNAHDHLELNHYGRLKYADTYEDSSQWIDDMDTHLRADPAIRRAMSFPLGDRLFAGGLKNLLSGVTFVAHHNPYYRELRRSVPIRVLRRYGWAHSFYLENRPAGARGESGGKLAARFAATRAAEPFIAHVAEGVNQGAREEFDRLEELGCLRANTVIVHGTAMTPRQWRRAADAGAGVVWCPGSNQFLFGDAARLDDWREHARIAPRHVAIGTDSRLTGSRDLLAELRVAAASGLEPEQLVQMVTGDAATLLREPDAGRLRIGATADFIIAPPLDTTPARALLRCERSTLNAVVAGGDPIVLDADLLPFASARGVSTRRLSVDGQEKLAEARLVRRIARCPISEPGVAVI